MKVLKTFFIFAMVSMLVVSCKETKKEEVQEGDTMEMTDEATSDAAAESDDSGAVEGSSSSAAEGGQETNMKEGKAMEATSKGVEEVPVAEGVMAEGLADTPVIYPGCASGSVDEIRACSKEKFVAFLRKEFKDELAYELALDPGDHEIRSLVKIDKTGKCSVLKIQAPHYALEKEMTRVLDKVPQLTPATKGGEAVDVTFVLPLNFKISN